MLVLCWLNCAAEVHCPSALVDDRFHRFLGATVQIVLWHLVPNAPAPNVMDSLLANSEFLCHETCC